MLNPAVLHRLATLMSMRLPRGRRPLDACAAQGGTRFAGNGCRSLVANAAHLKVTSHD